MVLIGAHLSVAGGVYKLFDHARYLDLSCIQCFTRNNRQWHFELFQEEEVHAYQQAQKASVVKVSHVVSHACYLINLCGSEEVQMKSVRALKGELQRCDQLKIPWTVIHPGSTANHDVRFALEALAQKINDILDDVECDSGILLENSAGQGSSIPYTLDDLAFLYSLIAKRHKKRIGICIDTCHAWAAGYNLAQECKDFLNEVDRIVGLENVKVFHCNDSQKGRGSHVDRHEHLGEGSIGKEAFEVIMHDKRLLHVLKILETPYNVLDDLKADVALLRSCGE